MAQIVVLPQLGNTVESCILTEWLVSVGDAVTESTEVASIETDKSAMEVPAGVSGVVLALLAEVGDEVPVKAPFLVVGAAGESVEEALAAAGAPPLTTGEAGEVDESTPDALTPQQGGAPAAKPAAASARGVSGTVVGVSPRARATAGRLGVDVAALDAGSGPGGRVIERDVESAAASGPGATRAAAAVGGPRPELGTGLGGRVTRADLTAAPAPAAPTHGEPTASEFPGAFTDSPLKGVRRIVADRMMKALATSAQLTYQMTAPAQGLLDLRKRFKESDPALGYTGITIGDLVSFAVVRTLARHASLNAHLLDSGLRTFEAVHLGLAVDTPRGLLVPTVRNAQALSLRGLSAASKEVATMAIEGRIDPDLLAGATFTVTNLGSFGMELFTPIINVPQTGILGVNAIVPRATMGRDGSPGVEMALGLSLTADHQVVDGADAARFLRDLVAAIANIDLTVVG